MAYKAVLLDVYGTLVRDDDPWTRDAAALVTELARTGPDVVAREWEARIWAMADTAVVARPSVVAMAGDRFPFRRPPAGVLRQAGGVWQFRHALLRDKLAAAPLRKPRERRTTDHDS